MNLIRRRAYARAGLIGNPSDGYFGRTISFALRNFWAEVVLYDWPQIEILWSQEDQSRFASIGDLVHDVRLHGYYGGVRLVKATVKRFAEYCRGQNLPLHDRNFSIRYQTNIPRQVGLAGSSAIIVATLRALIDFYQVDIPLNVQPSLALSVETSELGIPGGLQDRVIQVYEGLVFMDFARDRQTMQGGFACGEYRRLDPSLLRNVYVAYSTDAGEPTEATHNPLRARFEQGDPAVVGAMREWADLTLQAHDALVAHDFDRLNRLLDRNFDLRRGICQLLPEHIAMVEAARAAGASAKFAGSGGAIVGLYRDEAHFATLKQTLQRIGCAVIKPLITP